MDRMNYLLVRKGSVVSLGKKRSNSTLASLNVGDEMTRAEKSAPYRNPSYPTFLPEDVIEYKSNMRDHERGISDASKKLLWTYRYPQSLLRFGGLERDDCAMD
jgi:hypothetical protein